MNNGKQIADTTLTQLGGRMFIMMTGAKQFSYDSEGRLTFRIGGGASKRINAVQITVNASDYYDVKYFKGAKVVVEQTDVSVDMLRQSFTAATGFDTSMGRVCLA